MASVNPTNYVLMIAELRRSYAHLNSYKSDVVILSGLDAGDRIALDTKFKPTAAPPCQYDKEDLRFVLKGPHFAPMEILNCLAQQRGYKMIYPPQQHGIPLKQGAMDDKFALIYQLSKDVTKKPKTQTSISNSSKDADSKNKQISFSDEIITDMLKKQKDESKTKNPFDDALYSGKGWDKLMHGKIDSSDRRRPEHDTDEEDTDELDTEDEEEKNCLDMNIAYEDEEVVVECGDAGDI